jgi:predicted metal-dependent phosphoesterase TrpH
MKRPLINLHTHSVFSDGTLTPEAVAASAARRGVEYFSLTDHDTTEGWTGLPEKLSAAGLRWCCGVEISTSVHDSLHILGYGLDPFSPALAAALAAHRERRLGRLRRIADKLAALDVPISVSELPTAENRTAGRPHVAELLRKKGYVRTRKEAFERYLGLGKPAYEPPDAPDVRQAVELITAAGGKAVLAHPGVVAKVLKLAEWKELGLAGLEVFYPSHSAAFTRELLALAARYGLFVTAGTDFHGPGTDRDEMGGFEYDPELFAGVRELFR